MQTVLVCSFPHPTLFILSPVTCLYHPIPDPSLCVYLTIRTNQDCSKYCFYSGTIRYPQKMLTALIPTVLQGIVRPQLLHAGDLLLWEDGSKVFCEQLITMPYLECYKYWFLSGTMLFCMTLQFTTIAALNFRLFSKTLSQPGSLLHLFHS